MQTFASEDVVDVVLRASRALVAIAARSLADVDDEVTLPQYRALVFLCANGEVTMGGLTDELGCSPSAATRLCDRLVAKELIDRGSREGNRREVVVAIEPDGRRLVDHVTARRRSELERIVGAVPERQRTALVKALRAFSDAAGEAPDQAWSTGWDL